MADFGNIGDEVFGDVLEDEVIEQPGGFVSLEESDLSLEDLDAIPGESTTEEPGTPKEKSTEAPSSYLNSYLKKLGFNPDSIKVENEDGEIETFKFEELSDQDKLDILNYGREPQQVDVNLGEGWETVESYIKENNLSFNDFYEQIKEKVLQEHVAPAQHFEIDSLSDEQIYAYHLATLYGDEMTDDEIAEEVEKAAANTDRFSKATSKLRESYKEEERIKLESEQYEKNRIAQEEKQSKINEMVNLARGITDMHNVLDLEDSDKNIILNTIFTEDESGLTELDKALQNPKTKFKLAWYLKFGDETIDTLNKEYRRQIKALSTNTGKPAPSKPTVVTKNTPPNNKKPQSLNDLF